VDRFLLYRTYDELEVGQTQRTRGRTITETDIVNWFHEASLDAILCEAVFAARVRPEAAVAISVEHDDLRWLDPEAAKALVTWPAYVRAIEMIVWLVDRPERAAAFRLRDPG